MLGNNLIGFCVTLTCIYHPYEKLNVKQITRCTFLQMYAEQPCSEKRHFRVLLSGLAMKTQQIQFYFNFSGCVAIKELNGERAPLIVTLLKHL